MRFILDAQLSARLAKHLMDLGHFATHVFDHLEPAAGDLDIAALANRLDASVMSKDADFVLIAERGLLIHPFLWIRVPNMSNELLCARIDRAMPDVVSAVAENARIVEVR